MVVAVTDIKTLTFHVVSDTGGMIEECLRAKFSIHITPFTAITATSVGCHTTFGCENTNSMAITIAEVEVVFILFAGLIFILHENTLVWPPQPCTCAHSVNPSWATMLSAYNIGNSQFSGFSIIIHTIDAMFAIVDDVSPVTCGMPNDVEV